jgi:hypothetical protein
MHRTWQGENVYGMSKVCGGVSKREIHRQGGACRTAVGGRMGRRPGQGVRGGGGGGWRCAAHAVHGRPSANNVSGRRRGARGHRQRARAVLGSPVPRKEGGQLSDGAKGCAYQVVCVALGRGARQRVHGLGLPGAPAAAHGQVAGETDGTCTKGACKSRQALSHGGCDDRRGRGPRRGRCGAAGGRGVVVHRRAALVSAAPSTVGCKKRQQGHAHWERTGRAEGPKTIGRLRWGAQRGVGLERFSATHRPTPEMKKAPRARADGGAAQGSGQRLWQSLLPARGRRWGIRGEGSWRLCVQACL